MTVHDLSFPVLTAKGSGLVVYRSADQLTRWGDDALKDRSYLDIAVIDASLREFRIIDARSIGSAGGPPRWVPFVGHWNRVALELRHVGEMTLGNVKERVISAFNAGPDFWEAYASVDELAAEAQAASTFEQLVDAIP